MLPTTNSHKAAVSRGLLPEVLGDADISIVFGFASSKSGRRSILRGECGPYFRRGRRVYVLRTSFLAHLEAQAVVVTPRGPVPIPQAPEWARELLKRGRRRGLSAAEARQGARGGK